ncbi:MAG TPA: Calx-beta domain-containing protein [Cyclobacteriaceae bacterium]|nr:Calx-beta domain-containing protein [Cyclobacteriaceae bacterium]
MRSIYKLSWIPSLMVIVGLVFISSCKDDEKPKSEMAFAETEQDVAESAGTVEVKINIDRALSETVVLSYTVEGTASKYTPQAGGDYTISPEGGYITIAAGATEATIEIEIFEDGNFEYDFDTGTGNETVILTLTSVVSGPGKLSDTGLQYTLNIYEDDMVVFLDWDGSGSGDVDMDILVWYNNPTDNPDQGLQIVDPGLVGGGANPGNDSEAVLLLGGNPDANYGFSYVYYEGTADPLNFTATFVNLGGTVNGSASDLQFDGTYALANINPWDQDTGTLPHVAQTVTKSGTDYTNLTDIDVPATGSRGRIFGNMDGINKLTFRNTSAGVKKILVPKSFLQRFK